MLYFFYGSDKDGERVKVNALVQGLQKKKPNAEFFSVDPEHWNERQIDELIAGQGLFNKTYIVELVSLFEDAEVKELFLKKLVGIADSPNVFVMREGKVDKETLVKITKHAEKVQVCNTLKTGKPDITFFSFTDAFGRRNKRTLWVLFRKAVANGAVPEEIHGILFWQLKSILVASQATSASSASLAPGTFTKAKNFLKNYREEELKNLSSSLVRMYHDAHRGIHNFEVALERFILSL